MKVALLLIVIVLAFLAVAWIVIIRSTSGGLKRYLKPTPPDPHRGYPAGVLSQAEIARRMALVQKITQGGEAEGPACRNDKAVSLPEKTESIGPNISIVVTPGDVMLAELGRQATAAKDSGNLKAAVEYLVRQRVRAEEIGQRLSVQTLLRLPLFLQQNGDFERAMQEFDRLLDLAGTESGYPDVTPAGKAHAAAVWRGAVYDKMRVACRRQKNSERAAEYSEACDREREIAEALAGVLDEERRVQRELRATQKPLRRFETGV